MNMRFPSKRAKALTPALLLSATLAVPMAARAADYNAYAVDGYLSNDSNSNCMVLREHDGGTKLIAGAIGGLQSGDHVRLFGRNVDGSACNARGTAYQVEQVQTLWADDRHKTTYYDHLTDGSFDSFAQRRGGYDRNANRGNGYDRNGYDRNGYSNRSGNYDRNSYPERNGNYDRGQYGQYGYDNRGNLPLVSLRGRVYNDNDYCPTLHTSNGRVYGLVGDVSRLRDDSRVRVSGWMDRHSTECGNMPTIEVRSLSRY